MPSALKFEVDDVSTSTDSPAGMLEQLKPSHLEIASQILSIISRYKLAKDAFLAETKDGVNFLSHIRSRVAAKESILMCLPAFPFKSPNNATKVLGRLPDKAEEFALAHLNGLCAAIGDVYTPGARLMIVSDGLVYNDLLGVPDRDVWAYGEALRALRARKDFQHIEFCRLKDIVHVDVPDELDEIRYVANATNFRHALLQQFSKPGYNVSLRISEDEDTCLTYRGYIKFLETDLQNVYPVGEGRSKSKYKKGVEYIAKQMLTRGDAFARAVRQRFPGRLRLSIHPSTGENKLSINLLPTDTSFTTPWHCSIAFRLDGTVITGHRSQFDANDDFELVCEKGRPSYFREKSTLLSWASEKGGIICEPVYPTGLLIRPAAGRNSLSVRDVDTAKVRALSQLNSPIVLRDFARTRNRDSLVAKAHEFGVPTSWKCDVLGLQNYGVDDRELTHTLSEEWTQSCRDGICKEKRVSEDGSEVLVSMSPRFQFLAAVTKPPEDARYTMFSSSTLLFKHLPAHLTPSSLRPLTWDVSAAISNSTVIRSLPLVIDHPSTGRPCLCSHGPWFQSKSRLDATDATVDNGANGKGEDCASLCGTLKNLLHDRRVAYYHAWEKGDLLVSDNTLTIHQWSDNSAAGNWELWKTYFD
ncbi:Pyoverdine/dityrosine biosynthesis protein-domain-containing protein [Hypoxylon cercidicola]|nr:Pyoverdine/dityrosine biosynthesis protein-domain-containing protein [Hypoxylon cercidicola]